MKITKQQLDKLIERRLIKILSEVQDVNSDHLIDQLELDAFFSSIEQGLKNLQHYRKLYNKPTNTYKELYTNRINVMNGFEKNINSLLQYIKQILPDIKFIKSELKELEQHNKSVYASPKSLTKISALSRN